MVHTKDDNMGRFSVDVELANNDEVVLARRGIIPPEKVHRLTVRGVVDSGAAGLVIPETVARKLELFTSGETRVRYADGRTADRLVAPGIQLTWGGRTNLFSAIVEPGRDSALIGAIVLEALDLVVDCRNQELRPRDPNHIISEIE